MRFGQVAHQLHTGGGQNFGHLGTANGLGVFAQAHGLHGGGAIRVGPQAIGQFIGQPQFLQHLHEVNASRGQLRVGEVNGTGLAQSLAQGIRGGHRHGCLSGQHGDTSFDHAQILRRALHGQAVLQQVLHHGAGEDEHIARRAIDEFLLHGADRTKGAAQVQIVLRLKIVGQSAHQALCRAPTQNVQCAHDLNPF